MSNFDYSAEDCFLQFLQTDASSNLNSSLFPSPSEQENYRKFLRNELIELELIEVEKHK